LAALPSRALADEASPGAIAAEAKPVVALDYESTSTAPLLIHAVTRLRAELKVAGFAEVLPSTEPRKANDLGSVYGRVSLAVTGDELRLDIVSTSSATSSHAILLGTEHDVEGVMLQATEFLRAGLVPRLAPRSPRPIEPAPPSREPSTAPAPRRRWAVDAAATLATNWGAADLLPLASFAAHHYPTRRLSIGVAFDVPLAEAHYDASLGSAAYRIGLGSLEVEYALMRGTRAALSVGLGAGAARTLSSGQPQAPLQAQDASLWSLALGGSVRGELKVSRFLALTGRARVLGMSPNPLIAVIDDERRLGNPCFLFSLGARVTDDPL
jgi:hypothetical protein